MAIRDRVKRLWNAFRISPEETDPFRVYDIGPSYGVRPDRTVLRYTSERTILSSIFTRISIDVAAVDIKHIKVDDEDRYTDDLDSGLNECLLYEPNIDQGPRAFKQDIVLTLFDDGVAAVVPVDTVRDPRTEEVFDIKTLRVGKIIKWYPRHVTVSLYNIAKGQRQDVTLEKRFIAIVENPLYSVMNEPNSTMQRLTRKLNLLDSVDEASGSGKLDLIIQLPYVIKSEARRQQAEQRRNEIEFQLRGSEYGIAYTDGTEKITQLNRPAENNLLKQIEYLTNMLYGQLGLTEEVMNGTADEKAMINYFNRTVEPILASITEAMQRSLVGRIRTADKERVRYFKSPFKFVPVADLAEIGDKFTRNKILTANEIRVAIGFKPSKDPEADKLVNSNMPEQNPQQEPKQEPQEETGTSSLERTSQNGS